MKLTPFHRRTFEALRQECPYCEGDWDVDDGRVFCLCDKVDPGFNECVYRDELVMERMYEIVMEGHDPCSMSEPWMREIWNASNAWFGSDEEEEEEVFIYFLLCFMSEYSTNLMLLFNDYFYFGYLGGGRRRGGSVRGSRSLRRRR